MMKQTDTGSAERAQAFTLEGFISAIVLLTAILFALQAVVITPTTGGAVDRAAQAQEEQEVRDALMIAGENGDLSELVRNWNESQDKWQNGSAPGPAAYTSSQLANESQFGQILEKHFVNASGKSYNLDFIATNGSELETANIVRMGGGTGDSVVSASYSVAIHKNQKYTNTSTPINEDTEYPFKPEEWTGESYMVVKVRVTVW